MPIRRCVVALISSLTLGISSVSCNPGHGDVTDSPDLAATAPVDLSVSQPSGDLRGADLAIAECSATQYEGMQAPAAMLVLLDRSSSMAVGGKWTAAQQAIIQAIDQDAFDSMSLGLIAAPSVGEVKGPACILNLPVSCGVPGLPQVGIQAAGTNKSTAGSGVRSQINGWLLGTQPDNGIGDASPLFARSPSMRTSFRSFTWSVPRRSRRRAKIRSTSMSSRSNSIVPTMICFSVRKQWPSSRLLDSTCLMPASS